MLHSPAARQHLERQLVEQIVAAKEVGLALDFEQIPKRSQRDFLAFITELAGVPGRADLKLMVALPAADWDYDYAKIGRQADAVILMNYDDHWLTSPPGPIAPQDWFARNLDAMLEIDSPA